MGKYKFVNGVMVLDAPAARTSQVVPLAVACTPDDLAEATIAAQENNISMRIPLATQVAIGQFSEPGFIAKYKAPKTANLDGDRLLEIISAKFAQYEIPIGMLAKFLELIKYKVNFIIDDSGSMGWDTDSIRSQAAEYMAVHFKTMRLDPGSKMIRWEEAEDRLHVMAELLAYIPTEIITIGFMNRADKIVLDRTGKSPEQFLAEMHSKIRTAFTSPPTGGTPTLAKLEEAFKNAHGYTMHYLFTDGVPNEGADRVSECVLRRVTPQTNPLTFVSCTNQDSDADWMKEIEEKASFTAETDDYADERAEVLHDQGPVFPYTKGLWLMCLMVGAINPDDLDAMDDSRPFTRYTMCNILGRDLTEQEYKKYWDSHPKHLEFAAKYSMMLNENRCARECLDPIKPASTSAFGAVRSSFAKLGM